MPHRHGRHARGQLADPDIVQNLAVIRPAARQPGQPREGPNQAYPWPGRAALLPVSPPAANCRVPSFLRKRQQVR